MSKLNPPAIASKHYVAALGTLDPYRPGYEFMPVEPAHNPLVELGFYRLSERKKRATATKYVDGIFTGFSDWYNARPEENFVIVGRKWEETLWLQRELREYLNGGAKDGQVRVISEVEAHLNNIRDQHLERNTTALIKAEQDQLKHDLFFERSAMARKQAAKGPTVMPLEFPLDWQRVWDERRIMGLGSAGRYAPHMIAPYSGLKNGLDAPLIGMWPDRFRELDPTLVVDRSERHLTSIMITGGGKSACHIIPTLLTYKGSSVVMDTKGDLYRDSADQLRANGKRVLRLNLFEENSPDKYNPFDFIGGSQSAGFKKRIRLFVANLIDQKKATGDSAYWLQQADQAIRAITEYIVSRDRDDEPKNIAELLRLAKHPGGIKRTAQSLAQFADSDSHALEWSEGFIRTSGDWDKQAPITESEVKTVLDPWDETVQSNSLSSTFIPGDLVEEADRGEQFVLFIDMPSGLGQTYEAVIRTVLVCMIESMKDQRAKGDERGLPILFLLDEFLNYGRVEPIAKGLTELRSYGIRIWTFIQNTQLLEDLYPGEWKTFLDNASVIYGATNDDDTAKKLSDAFGDVTYEMPYYETDTEKIHSGDYNEHSTYNPQLRWDSNFHGYVGGHQPMFEAKMIDRPVQRQRIHHQTEEVVPIRAINNLPLPWQIIRPIGAPPVLCAKLPYFDPIFQRGLRGE